MLGVGINVQRASYPPEIAARATSIEAELGRSIDRTILLDELLVTIPARYNRLCQGDADDILRAWRIAAPSARGTRVEWSTPQGPRHGVTAGIDDAGALLVQTASGLERIIAGEIRWE